MKLKRLTIFAAAVAACAPAWAVRPANIAGTTWLVHANRSTEQLVITNQAGPGAPGGPNCPRVIGTIGPAPVEGSYCGVTGELWLLHNNMATGATVRVIHARITDVEPGKPNHMAGEVFVNDAAFGDLGTYNFQGSQQ